MTDEAELERRGVSYKTAAWLLDLSYRTIYRAARAREFEVRYVGRTPRIDYQSLMRWWKNRPDERPEPK